VSAATIKADIQQTYDEKKLEVQHALQTSILSIHFSCDAWTSPANLGILGIVAHFVSEDGGLQKLVLGMKELEGTHSGVNMAKELWTVVEDFGITANLGYFVSDSHPSNDTMLRELSQLLSLHGVTDTWDPILQSKRHTDMLTEYFPYLVTGWSLMVVIFGLSREHHISYDDEIVSYRHLIGKLMNLIWSILTIRSTSGIYRPSDATFTHAQSTRPAAFNIELRNK
jgi:hypothetical protein